MIWANSFGGAKMCLTPQEIREMYYEKETKAAESFWPTGKQSDSWPEPEPKKIRSPQDILDEVAGEEQKQFEELLAECNRNLPREKGKIGEVRGVWAYKDYTVTRVLGELRKAGWKAYKHYNNIRVEFPDDVA